MGTRKGACIITYPFWHQDVMDMIPLNDAGGAEDNRARKLKYSMRIHNLLKTRVIEDGNISLFNPKDVPLLNSTYGNAFDEAYKKYESDNKIPKKTVKARELWFMFIKHRKETGNIYGSFTDNINQQNMLNEYVGQNNLCMEIALPSSPSSNYKQNIITNEDGKIIITESKDSGEIALCNLASINLLEWYDLSIDEKYDLVRTLIRGFDNVLDTQYYPVKEGKVANLRNRPIGIGVTNYAALLADHKLMFDDHKTLEFTHNIFEELYYIIYDCSSDLAKDRGSYPAFRTSNWVRGKTPIDVSILNKMDNDRLNYPYKYDWNKLGKKIRIQGIRFGMHGAVAPTATNAIPINATESTEPITEVFSFNEGTQTLPSIVPRIKNRMYYHRCWEVPNKSIIELAAIRQKFIDQAQSINFYYKNPESAYELTKDVFYAMELGVKSIYYQKSPKAGFESEYVCESCT
jgi:ribonucleoside-diphosphate reductase alpha chain